MAGMLKDKTWSSLDIRVVFLFSDLVIMWIDYRVARIKTIELVIKEVDCDFDVSIVYLRANFPLYIYVRWHVCPLVVFKTS